MYDDEPPRPLTPQEWTTFLSYVRAALERRGLPAETLIESEVHERSFALSDSRGQTRRVWLRPGIPLDQLERCADQFVAEFAAGLES